MRLLYILSVSVLLFSCKKEYSYEGSPVTTNEYYITANINGADREFNFDTEAAYTTASGGYSVLEMTAFASADQADNTNITLDIYYDPATVSAPGVGTYDQQTDDYFEIGIYDFNDPDKVYVADNASTITSAQPLSITITSVTPTVVEGYFSGAFYLTDVLTGTTDANSYVIINNGKFRLPLQ